MMIRCILTVALANIVLIAGCASTPAPDPRAAATTHHVQLASARLETGQPATLPAEPFLDAPQEVDFFVQIALERNPEILAAQRAVTAQAHVIPQVTALADPVVTDVLQPFDNYSVQTAAGRGPNTLTLTQTLPWLSKLRVRGEVAEQDAKIALTRLAQSELKVIEDVKLAYYDLAYNQEAITIIESDQDLLEQLLQFADARYRTGTTSQQDVLRAEVELERLEDSLIVLRRQLGLAQADLAKVLHTSPDANLQAKTDIDLPPVPEQIEALYEAAIRCRPELQERLHAIIRAERKQELARLNYYPDFNVGVGWQAITADSAISPVTNSNDNVSLLVGVSLPIWRDKLDAGVREAENRILESARRYDASRDDTFRLIRRLIVRADALGQQIDLFDGRIIPLAEQTLRVSTADYRVNKVDFQQILDNWSDLLNFHLQLTRFEADLNQTLASLERVVGCQLATLPEAQLVPIDELEPVPEMRPPLPNDPAAGGDVEAGDDVETDGNDETGSNGETDRDESAAPAPPQLPGNPPAATEDGRQSNVWRSAPIHRLSQPANVGPAFTVQ